MENKRIVFGICGSFCNHQNVLKPLKALCARNDVQVVVSENVFQCSTRFFEHHKFISILQNMSHHSVLHTIVEAETIGPSKQADIMVIAPMSASVAARLVNGLYDHPVVLAAKAMIRNDKNIVFGIASNDVLGISGPSIMRLLAMKHMYAIPFRQDDPIHKPCSMVADWTLLEATLDEAIQHHQLQPLILGAN